MEKILSSTRKVRFQDCDPFNHLNNSKYIDYFINAREDQLLENYQFDIFEIARNAQLSWVIGSHQIAYLKPALLMEEIVIESQLMKYDSHSLLVELRMTDKNKTHLKSLMWTSFVHFDLKTNRLARHSDEFISLFVNVVAPVEQDTFEERREFLTRKPVRSFGT